MPAGDGTGPIGMGPRTGRGAGYCSGYDAPGWANPMPGRGLGLGRGAGLGRGIGRGWSGVRGRGGGWGQRNWYHATGVPGWARLGYAPAYGAPPVWGPPAWGGAPYVSPEPEQEVEFLRRQAEMLKQELDAIARRVEELTGEA